MIVRQILVTVLRTNLPFVRKIQIPQISNIFVVAMLKTHAVLKSTEPKFFQRFSQAYAALYTARSQHFSATSNYWIISHVRNVQYGINVSDRAHL